MTTTVLPRLAPAVVGGKRIHVECPSWCTIDHVADPEGFLEDLWHASEYADLEVPRMGQDPELLVFARLGIDSFSSDPAKRSTFVVVDNGGEGHYMRPDQAEEFAASLEAFAEKIRDLARTARDAA